MKKFLVPLLVLSISLTNCTTIINGSKQSVSVLSRPTGADVYVDGQLAGKTPMYANVKRKNGHAIRVVMDGYEPYEVGLTRKLDGWVFGNIIFGGIIGLIIDASTGSMYKLTPNEIKARLAGGDTQTTSVEHQKDGVYILVTMNPDPSWEKIGTLEKAK
ncbi:PEGA domain-containing protein [Siphonobacter sp. SORGH_AS_0500]|uniref:PEGA domain-containing protein n=1 Tax=Siphonobacter sp. SORGH_AS_0500 TaxID=1864824 RepID=UPI000CC2AD18|nr:PEGA domain-containing protein [Siphonobacter sp. SORGH_AS_0500]MDR6194278.1 hypothetical protein [Siphonobacter sp. SORGH_AS_0500]PKK37063.1 hypothetical protein BWI96_09310 [Siphonobacter sp. SORGH_AS_0500]